MLSTITIEQPEKVQVDDSNNTTSTTKSCFMMKLISIIMFIIALCIILLIPIFLNKNNNKNDESSQDETDERRNLGVYPNCFSHNSLITIKHNNNNNKNETIEMNKLINYNINDILILSYDTNNNKYIYDNIIQLKYFDEIKYEQMIVLFYDNNDNNNNNITLTPNHLLYYKNNNNNNNKMSLIKSENIKIGDYIYICKQGEKKVNKIEYTLSQPRLIITKSGNIIANNVIASNFAV